MVRRALVAALTVTVMTGIVPLLGPAAPAGADDSPPPLECPAALPGPRSIVRRAYMVLLRRCPDAAGAAAWEAALRDGMSTETFARRITATPEARGVVVTDAYRTVLARTPGAAERAFWVGWLRPDPTRLRRHDQLLAELAASVELWNASDRDATTWVVTVYERILQRRATDADATYWRQRLAASDRRSVARTLLRLSEPLGAEVTRVWEAILDALPTPAQRTWEAARLRDGDRLALAARLVGSPAFADRAEEDALVVPGRYVAMGDSFVIGEGNEPWIDVPSPMPEPGEPERWRCGYAVSAYPEVARTTSEQVPSDMDVPACTGASMLDLYPYVEDGTYPEGPFLTKRGGPGATGGRIADGGPVEATDEPDEAFSIAGQIDAIAEGPAPTLVTLTIGGNDVGFTSIVQSCLQIRIQGQGQHSPYYSAEDCDAWLDELAPAAIEELRTGLGDVTHPDGDGYQCPGPCSLTSALTDVAEAAPEARVLVVGYPPLMPPVDAGCKGLVRFEGVPNASVEWYVAPADVRRGRKVIADLNAALREAAEAAGATYVDPGSRFAGHEVCSPAPWIHGVNLDADAFPLFSTFHPNRRGGVGLAAAVIDALGG